MKNIGIFGGTFNPLHKGHIKIAEFVKDKENLDEVWIIPAYKSPSTKFTPFKNNPKQRFSIASKTIKDLGYDWLKVSNLEMKHKKTSFTFKTVKELNKKYPKDNFTLIIGDDHWKNFDKWRNTEYIIENINIVWIRRNDISHKDLEEDSRFKYYKDFYFEVSSSKILKEARWDLIHDLTKPYIAKKYYYIRELAYFHLNNGNKENKYVHSMSVAKHAKRLAKVNKYHNIEKAYYVGLAHDLFKNEDPTKQIKYIMSETDWELPPKAAAHGYYAALWFQNEYKINDEEFTNAIKKHTLASGTMSKLDKILYVADKIADDRKDEVAKHYRKLAYKNLDMTFYRLLKESEKKLTNKGIELHPETIKAIENYKI